MWLFIAGATSTGLGAGQVRGRHEVVGLAGGHLGDRVRGGRRDAEGVTAGGQLEMADRIVVGRLLARIRAPRGVALPLLDEHRGAGDALERRAAHEPHPGGCLDHPHRMTLLRCETRQLHRLVGGDAAAHTEENPCHSAVSEYRRAALSGRDLRLLAGSAT